MRSIAAFLLLTASGALYAQTTSTSILGTVSDASGAVVAGAKVVATNVNTNTATETISSSTGDYTFPLIDVGEYKVEVSMAGFKSATRSKVIVQINEKVRVDFRLDVGQITDRVEVAAQAATLQTDEASLGTAVEQRRLVELPVNGRNVGNVAILQAGVMFGSRGGLDGQTGGGGGIPIPGQTIAIVANGQREVSQHATLDGVVATESRVNTVPFSPSPEAMEEVKVLTGSYSAEYGFNSGAQLVMVMRSGANQVHGAAYDFLRNQVLDAESYFQNYFNPPGVARQPKQQLRQNQFGAVLSGPILIPHLYNGRNKTFFSFNYEGRRRSEPGSVGTALVPSDAMRNGDFSKLLTLATPVPITDPLNSAQPLAGNVIPANRISSVAKAINSFWEKPQVDLANPLTGFNFLGVGGQTINDDQYFVRIDHNFSEKDKIFFRYATNIPTLFRLPGASPQFTYRVEGRNNNYAGQWLHIFTPTLVNEFRYGWTQSRDDSFNPRANTTFDLSALGMDGFRVINDGNRKLTAREAGLPSMNVQGFQTLAEADGGNGFDNNKMHVIGDNLNLTFASHSLKFGGEFRRISLFRGAANVPRGAFTFTNSLAGNAYAAFLLGTPASTDTPEGLPLTDVRQNRMGFYAQDDWKATRKLTVNIGLRWEYNTAATDVQGLWRSLRWTNGLNSPPEFVPAKIRTTYTFYDPQKTMFMPRLGLAYRVTDNWVVRAGSGIYYNVHQLNNYTILNLNPPLSGSTNFANSTSNGAIINPAAGYFGFANPFGAINRSSAISANVLNPENFQPVVYQWSLDVQRRLPGDLTLNVGYVGSKTAHLDNTVEFNSPDPAFNTASSSLQSRRPVQFVIDDGVQRPLTRLRWLDSGANAWYQGLQTTLQKRFARGFAFSLAHTWSKSLMEGYGRNEGDGFNPNAYQNPRNRAADKQRAGFDVTHNLVASFVYEIPVMASMKKGPASLLFAGWQTNGILSFRTGFPYTVVQANLTNLANVTPRPDRIADGSLSNASVNKWYDPAAFVQVTCQNTARPDLCKYGNAGQGILEGPGFKNVDFSMFKNFKITETFKLQFRTELFNLFNTPQFGRPNNNISNPLPGQITSTVSPMRQIQFGLKLLW